MIGIRDLVTPANAITSGSLVAGFLGLLAVVDSQMMRAVVLVILAAVLDSFDGAVARRGGGDRAFGTNLDSLADLVAFGVVPAMALYLGPLRSLPVLGLAASLLFLLAAAWRLARFPLVKRCDFFLGLPVPVAGVLLMVLPMWRPGPGLILVLTCTFSALMVSTMPFPTLHTIFRGPTGIRSSQRRWFPRR